MTLPIKDRPLNDLRQRLLCRIRRRYQVVTEEITLGPARFDFTRIVDADRVLDEVAAEADLRDRLQGHQTAGDELHLPYWAELWDSARGIGVYLSDPNSPLSQFTGGPDVLNSRRAQVLDLGCGMGLAGTVAAALGANVTFADLEPPALLFAQLNSLPWKSHVRTRRLNWQRDELERRFDLIIGSDILYEQAQWPFLETFWKAHLSVAGTILLGEPGRQTGDSFVDWITAKGWQLVTTEARLTTRPRSIRILKLTTEKHIS